MYAVISTGGKHARVNEGQVLNIERLEAAEVGSTVEFVPVLVVDGASVLSTKTQLGAAKVTAKILGETKGKKLRCFTYKNKSNQRKRWGHRQRYTQIEITNISGAKKS